MSIAPYKEIAKSASYQKQRVSLIDLAILKNFAEEKIVLDNLCKESVKDIYSAFKLFQKQKNVSSCILKRDFKDSIYYLLINKSTLKANDSIELEKTSSGFFILGIGLKTSRFEEALVSLNQH